MSVSFTRRARYLTFAGLATLTLGAVAQLAVTPAATSADTYTVPLHNTTTNDSGDCPQSPPLWGWHFVVPAQGDSTAQFVSLSLQFQTAGTVNVTVDPTSKHAYVYTPTDDTLLSGTAEVTSSDVDSFNLSHTCAGSTTETPSPTPSVSPSETPSATPSESPSETPSASPSESSSETPSASPSESPSETPTATPSESPSETPTATPSESPSATPTAEVSATETATESSSPTPGATVLPTRITRPSASPSVEGVKNVRPPVLGDRLTTTGSPVPIGLLLLLGFGLVGAGVLTTVAGEPRTSSGPARHRR